MAGDLLTYREWIEPFALLDRVEEKRVQLKNHLLRRFEPMKSKTTDSLSIYVYGAGQIGRQVVNALRSLSGVRIPAIIESTPHASTWQQIPVLKPGDLVGQDSIDFIILATAPKHYLELRRQLEHVVAPDKISPLFMETNKHVPTKRLFLVSLPKSGTRWLDGILRPVVEKNINMTSIRNLDQVNLTSSFYFRHHSAINQLQQFLDDRETKIIFLYRDPRDCAVSHMNHILYQDGAYTNRFHDRVQGLSDDLVLSLIISGFRFHDGIESRFPSIQERSEVALQWLEGAASFSNILPLRYEDLKDSMEPTLKKIATFLGWEEDLASFEKASDLMQFARLSGREEGVEIKQSGFRKGIVGDWVNHFKAYHKDQFKYQAGDQLIQLGYASDYSW